MKERNFFLVEVLVVFQTLYFCYMLYTSDKEGLPSLKGNWNIFPDDFFIFGDPELLGLCGEPLSFGDGGGAVVESWENSVRACCSSPTKKS